MAKDRSRSDPLQEQANIDLSLDPVSKEEMESKSIRSDQTPSTNRSLPVWIRETSQDVSYARSLTLTVKSSEE